jgi:hypothetical protein
MRRRNRPANHPHQPPPPPPAATGQQPVYDWTRFGRHRLRAPDAVIVDLPVPITAARQVWVATVFPDSRVAGGWARLAWEIDQDTQRGWRLPMQLAAGDVLEFGADTPTQPVRWYGIMDSYEVDRWATVQGPYPHPAAAWDDAQRLLALERFLPPLEAEPATEREPCHRSHRDRAKRRRRHQ